jgi:hypothetical protein
MKQNQIRKILVTISLMPNKEKIDDTINNLISGIDGKLTYNQIIEKISDFKEI